MTIARPTTMRVVRLHGPRDLRLVDEPPPEPGPGEVLLRVTAVGLCGSDRHWFEHAGIGETPLGAPLVLGHEFVGIIESGRRRGERVAADPAHPCAACAVCTGGSPHLCPTVRFAGLSPTDGALREWVTWPAELLHHLPDSIPDAEASLLEVLGIALHALDLGAIRPGIRAGVFGCGPVGLLVIAALRAAGVGEIVATDVLTHRVAAARRMGASATLVDPGAPPADPPGGPVDVAFECAGEDPAVEAAIRAAAPGGHVVLVGIPEPDRTTFTASIARRKGLTLVFCRRMRRPDLPAAIRLAATGKLDLGSLVTHRFGLAEVPAAFDVLDRRAGLKVVVEPGADR